MRPPVSASSLLLAVPLLAAIAACGKDPDLTPTTSSTGTGGASTGGSGGSTSSGDTGGGTTTTTTTTPEPAGPTKLTVLNAINDYDAIRVCFVPYPSGAKVDPWPASAGGLAFGKPTVVDPPSSLAPGGSDVQPHVIAGDLSAIAGMSCDEALALAASGQGGTGGTGGAAGGGGAGGAPPQPPPIVVSDMPVIPASVFQAEKSLLLAFYGCIGGKADGTETLGCGFTFTPATPTAGLTLVAMSRIKDPASIALQFIDASAAMQPSDIRITPGFDGVGDVPVVKAIALGGLGPKPPFTDLSHTDYGSLPKVAVKTFAPNDVNATSTYLLQDALTKGSIDSTAFVDGSSFTIAAIGGYPGVMLNSFWHPFTYVAFPSDPP